MKKTISLLLAVVMIFSLLPTAVFAVGAAPFESVASISGKTITVSLKTSGKLSYANLTAKISVSNGLACTSIEKGTDYSDFNANEPVVNPSSGIIILTSKNLSSNTQVDSGKELCVFTVDASSAADGEYNFSIEFTAAANVDGAALDWQEASITSNTVTVGNSTPATQGYELYYTLNSSTDSDSDKYIDYDVGSTVTATIYLKSNLADTLQAFDLYITNDENLTYTGLTSAKGSLITEGTGASTATSQHIQGIGASKTDPINVALPAGEGVEIAKLTFTVANSAVYNTALPITIQATSNIAVANTPASFTPDRQTVSSATLGAETLKTYNVTYNDNVDGEDITVPDGQTKQHNVVLTLSATEPARTGYTFKGWSKTSGASNTVDYAKDASFTENADTPLYAVWEANKHTVMWKSQDGSSTLETDENVSYGTTLSYDSAAPTKAADAQYTYTFVGWATTTDSETGAAANTFTMGDADMTLYAAFSKETNKYTVTWKNEDGTVLETDTDVAYGTTPTYDGAPPTKAEDNTCTYAFDKWSPDVAAVTGNAEYTATYTSTYKNYTVAYALGEHPADGKTAPASETKHNGETVTLPNGPAAADGYAFTGWSDGTNAYAAGAIYTIFGAGATMTAQYAEKTYTVTYDGNTGTGTAPASHTSQSFTVDFTAAANTFTKIGYTFNGWNTKADGSGTPVTAGSVYKISTLNLDSTTLADTTITLYAQWVRESDYAITYELNGGTVATANPTSYNVDTPTFTLNNPTKTGYTFKGWSGTDLTGDENTTVTIAQGSTGVRSYTANWTPAEVSYTVNHYQENIDGTYPATPTETETKQGYTESNTAAVAKTYDHFTAQTFSQVAIAADGSTVVSIYYLRDTYTVTYGYTGTVPTDAPQVPTDSTSYKYGATVTVSAAEITLAGYDFSGWSKTGTFTIEENTTITGSWTAHAYHIRFYNESNNLVTDGDQTFTVENKTITEPTVPDKSENSDWYNKAWSNYSTDTLADQTVNPVYTEKTFTITFKREGGDVLGNEGDDHSFSYTDKTITEPTVPDKTGYTGVWTYGTNNPSDQTITPTYTPVNYTIIFETDGGTAIAAMTYTIESTDTLPSAAGKTNYSFVNWKVTTAGGNWNENDAINGGTQVTGKYGNVTLTAQWTQSLRYTVEEYKYAPADYRLLIVDAAGAGEGQVYKYDGATMYYTTDENYMIGDEGSKSTAVFYTLIPATANTLTDAEVAKIVASTGDQATITYDGDINGDGKVNIADANAIFQMVVAKGTYYSTDQLDIAQRLAADMVKATGNAEHRGSIEDVNAVVAIINGTNS